MNPTLASFSAPTLFALLPRSYSPSTPPKKLRIHKSRCLNLITRCYFPAAIPTPISVDGLLRDLISAFPSVNSLELLVPALGFVSGAAFYLASTRGRRLVDFAGDWVLFSNPTPFNRSVFLRCPSLTFEDGGELLDAPSEQLARLERHRVQPGKGRIPVCEGGGEEVVKYQRICLRTDDGGVVSLDWPENLDLEKEQGLETTVVLVPGSTEGSMDGQARAFVRLALKCGFFPVVMNPRGCAGSPLTSPRLFTAADSDDVCTVVQFIKSARPWATLVGVGWQYGANMLTKYLGEFGEQTPLTAATCLNNPFDLEEATESSAHPTAADQRFIGGLKQILESNKELFQGKSKGFNLSEALSVTSVRDFDRAISMICFGFESIKEFYTWSSTTHSVGNIKIPVLFIQSDGSNPLFFSIPRVSVSENPFTSLLVCYPSSSDNIDNEKSSVTWHQSLTIEWLQAVELALLKGRHPILKDVDLSISPSVHYSMTQSKQSRKHASRGSRITESSVSSRFEKLSERKSWIFHQLNDPGTDLSKLSEEERDQMLRTVDVLLDMLDSAMPGILDDDQRARVLRDIREGEPLMKALVGAVPEKVWVEVLNAVDEIIQKQGRDINFRSLVKHDSKTSIDMEKMKQVSTLETDGTQNKECNANNINKLDGTDALHPESCPPGTSNLQSSNAFDSGKKVDNISSELRDMKQDVAVFHGTCDLENAHKHGIGAGSVAGEESVDTISSNSGSFAGEGTVGINTIEEKGDSDNSNTIPVVPVSSEEGSPASSSLLENRTKEEQKDAQENKDQNDQTKADQKADRSTLKAKDTLSHISSGTPIDVSEALDAFQTFDDSTQKAVNSVFGVIENVIDQLEKKKEKYVKKESETGNQNDTREGSHINNLNSKKMEEDNHQISDDAGSSDRCESISRKHADEFKDIKCTKDDGRLKFDHHSSDRNVTHMSSGNNINRLDEGLRYPLQLTTDAHLESTYRSYLRGYFLEHMSDMRSYNSRPTTDLFLDHEKGYWKMLYNIGSDKLALQKIVKDNSTGQTEQHLASSMEGISSEKIIDTSYVVVGKEKNEFNKKFVEGSGMVTNEDERHNFVSVRMEKLVCLIKTTILDVLEVEVRRKLGISDVDAIDQNLSSDMEAVANAIAFELLHDGNFVSSLQENGSTRAKFGTISGHLIINNFASAIQQASHLQQVLPAGVIVGSSLVSLGRYFDISSAGVEKQDEAVQSLAKEGSSKSYRPDDSDRKNRLNSEMDAVDSCNGDIMVGAVTAALSASALFACHQTSERQSQKEEGNIQTHVEDGVSKSDKVEKMAPESEKNDVVGSHADKTVSAAEPVIPTANEPKVDQERLLTILSELGQKGGLLRYLGNIALLWGGIRGALSLNDRLIRFLGIAERPLIHRVLGFIFMTLVIWSPVVVPLLPHVIRSWKAKRSIGISGYTCLFGLQAAILIFIMLWGKRIRGYEFPLEQYGLNLTSSPQVHAFIKGFLGGIFLVSGILSLNTLLGIACFTWPSNMHPVSAGFASLLKAYGSLVLLTLKGITTATCVATVEELLFRSWLPDEISIDLGFHWAIIISGLAFAALQRSLSSTPGFLFLSLALFGAKQWQGGSLSVPIGIRTGIMFSTFLLKELHFVLYKPNSSFWLAGSHPWHPFDGIMGLVVTMALAVLLYPRRSVDSKKA